MVRGVRFSLALVRIYAILYIYIVQKTNPVCLQGKELGRASSGGHTLSRR